MIGSRATWLGVFRQRETGLAVLIGLMVVVAGIADTGFLSRNNWNDIVVRCAPTSIVACGVMLVVVTGEIDISVGSLMALLAAVLGLMISRHEWHLNPWIGIPTTLILGTCVGAMTGLIVTVGRVPSIVATLGLLTALRGITTWIMSGKNIDGLPDGLTRATKQGVLGLPLAVWVAIGVLATTHVIIHHMPLGRRLYALGSSPYSARMAGLSERRLKLFAFAYAGFLTAVATVVDVPRLPKIEAGIGTDFELLVVTCVVVGGISISGGRGRLSGVMLAVLLMTIIRPVLTFLDLGESGEKWTKAIQGALILLAVVSDSVMTRREWRPRG